MWPRVKALNQIPAPGPDVFFGVALVLPGQELHQRFHAPRFKILPASFLIESKRIVGAVWNVPLLLPPSEETRLGSALDLRLKLENGEHSSECPAWISWAVHIF